MSVLLAPEDPSAVRGAAGQLSVSGESLADFERPGSFDRRCRSLLISRLPAFRDGPLQFVDGEGTHGAAKTPHSELIKLHVVRPRAYRRMVLGGSLSAAESYLEGDWRSDDLVGAMQVLCRQAEQFQALNRGPSWLMKPWRRIAHFWNRNTRRGSRRNIAAHYDLGNDFFALMLDPTMTYSSGLFADESTSMEQASVAKYDRICRQLKLQPTDRVVEVGCGWGGFALHAARHYGSHVTATTISREQFDFARRRVESAGLSDRVEIVMRDYRELDGNFDKLVSIEMIEAVGERYLDQYFAKCSQLLKPDGLMMLQAITIPDCRYDSYRRSVDFIQRYIFPGGFLPSPGAISASLGRTTDFRQVQQADFAEHYAITLSRWRQEFWRKIEAVWAMSFDDRFIRMWHYYLCYCEAGFRERQIGLSQLLLAKPLARVGMPADVLG